MSDLSNLCRSWRTLPKGKDYLAAGVPIMELLYSEAGSRLSRKHLSTTHLQWHRRSILFEQCGDTGPDRCACDRTQQIYHDSLLRTFGQVRPPGKLEENGCVIFGQVHHSLKPTKTVPLRKNAIHMLPNTSIQDSAITNANFTRDDGVQSPSSPASLSQEREEFNGDTVQSPKSPPSPLISNDELVQKKPVARERMRKMSHVQTSNFDPCKGPSNFDTSSLSEFSADQVSQTLTHKVHLKHHPELSGHRPQTIHRLSLPTQSLRHLRRSQLGRRYLGHSPLQSQESLRSCGRSRDSHFFTQYGS